MTITGTTSDGLDEKSHLYRLNSVADSTKISRQKHWDDYVRTCELFGWSPLPCTVVQACRYVTFLAERLKFSSICAYYQSVIFFHVCLGLVPVRMSDPVLRATLKGIQRSKGDVTKGKDPLLPVHLLKISKIVDWLDELDVVVFIACLFMFRTLLRVSHVVKSAHTLKVADVKFDRDCCFVRVVSSKTTKKASVVLPVNQSSDDRICAVKALKYMLSRFKASQKSYLFSSPKYPVLTYSVFAKKFKDLTRLAGLSGDFASHSLRRGGATFMSTLNCPINQIKARGQWKSDCVYRYIVPTLASAVEGDKRVAVKC